MPSPKLKPPLVGSLGASRWDSRARSGGLSLRTAIPGRAFPGHRMALSGGTGARTEPRAAPGVRGPKAAPGAPGVPGPKTAPGAPGARCPRAAPGVRCPRAAPGRGEPQRQCRRVLPPRSGPLKGVGRPEAANQLETTSEYADGRPGGQVQHQRPATFPVYAALVAPGVRQERAIRCRAAGCPGGQRPRRAILAWNLAGSPIQDPG